MDKWFTVYCIEDTGDAENGPCINCWIHPFNYDTAEDALKAAKDYYSICPEISVVSVHPSTEQEVIEFLDECYGPHENEDLPF